MTANETMNLPQSVSSGFPSDDSFTHSITACSSQGRKLNRLHLVHRTAAFIALFRYKVPIIPVTAPARQPGLSSPFPNSSNLHYS